MNGLGQPAPPSAGLMNHRPCGGRSYGQLVLWGTGSFNALVVRAARLRLWPAHWNTGTTMRAKRSGILTAKY